jgi:SAM-dependent methyltransferase
VLAAGAAVPESPAFVHTLRELEGAALRPADAPAAGREPAALLFRAADFPAGAYETVNSYIERLLSGKAFLVVDPTFRVVRFEEPSDHERPELTRRLPGGALRILDVGCGAGAGIASAKIRHPAWAVTGIEWDRDLVARARSRCDRVVDGDLARILPILEKEGELFEAVVFADVLEHLEDPVAALAAGRRVAAPGARLIVSVPNVGHLSIARDLVAGRFDPIPAGLTDARHLRWFTRTFLAEALDESGWRTISIESEAGAPAPDAAAFLALAAAWPDRDLESLATYQWIAVAAA